MKARRRNVHRSIGVTGDTSDERFGNSGLRDWNEYFSQKPKAARDRVEVELDCSWE